MSKKSGNRVPLQVSPLFREKLKELQRKVNFMAGIDKSLTDLTEEISKSKAFEDVEKKILERKDPFNIKIKLDGKLN